MSEPIYNTRSLFSSYYLEKVVAEQTDASLTAVYQEIQALYVSIAAAASRLNEAQTEEQFIRPVLRVLGHAFEVQPVLRTAQGTKQPDYAFFADTETLHLARPQLNTDAFFNTATAIGDAKAWGRNLDRRLDGPGDAFSNSNPNYQIDFYIRTSGVTWGILTNGKQWRLYHRDTSYRLDSFYEVDLGKVLVDDDIDAFRYFYYFFRREAFAHSHAFLDDVLTGSARYTVAVSDNLADSIYSALEALMNGFLTYPDNQSLGQLTRIYPAPSDTLNLGETELETLHENCLILLYRLLFILYAESRGLLPLEDADYRAAYSLDALAAEVHAELDAGTEIPTLRSDYWARLQDLCRLIDKGWEERIPQYNGGLFNPARHPFLETAKIGNAVLAEVINLLTRTTEKERIAYQDLAIQHLGNIYEGLLEYNVRAEGKPPVVRLIRDKKERKASGSYYTSDAIVRAMVEDALDALCSRKSYDEILRLKVLDPAMGSGHFLVGAIDYLALQLATHPDAPPIRARLESAPTGGSAPTDRSAPTGGSAPTGRLVVDTDTEIAYWRRRVVENCIYGVDLNPMAVELAKVSLWLHTVAKGEPLSFLDHHIRCGNSLIGANITELANLPALSKRRRADETPQTALSMDFGWTDTVSEAVGHYLVIEKMEGQTADDIHAMEQELQLAQQRLSRHKAIANLWMSVHFGNAVKPGDYRAFTTEETGAPLDLPVYQKARELAERYRFFHWEIEFPEVFRDELGQALAEPGFDAILANPPYGAKFSLHEKTYLKRVAKDTRNPNSAALFIDAAKNRMLKSDGVLAFIVPKSLLYVESWRSLAFALLDKTRVLVDVEAAFKNVKLEQAFFIYDTHHTENYYTARKFVDETWMRTVEIPASHVNAFQAWICDVSLDEIRLGERIHRVGTFMREISHTTRGLSVERLLNPSGDIAFIGGKNINRYSVEGVKGFLNNEALNRTNQKVQSLLQPKIISQKIVTTRKITATVDKTGDILGVNTVENTFLTVPNFHPNFIVACFNSTLVNWYAHRFIYCSARMTMFFDNYYIGKIPIPVVSLAEQQPIIELVEQIMAAKREDPGADTSSLEGEIDTLVYALYGVTEAEVAIVEG